MNHDFFAKQRRQDLKKRRKKKFPALYLRIGEFELFNTSKKNLA